MWQLNSQSNPQRIAQYRMRHDHTDDVGWVYF